jgi:hypothetical protein
VADDYTAMIMAVRAANQLPMSLPKRGDDADCKSGDDGGSLFDTQRFPRNSANAPHQFIASMAST